MSFIQELKRRNVFKVGAAYVVMAWLIAQGVDVFLENFGAPDWVIKTILLLLVAGLPIALFFAWAFELTPEGIKKEKDVDRSQSITHETGRKLDYTIIAILLVALTWFAWDKFSSPTPPDIPASSADMSSSSTVIPAQAGIQNPPNEESAGKTIAVLPFVNMSEDASNEYFSDGISEEILNALAKVKDLQVAGRTSSFAFKGQNEDLRQIGQTLGVNHVLEGSVRKAGNKVRVTAQLIQVDNGFHLWSESYDRELDDVFAIQDEIANAILHELKATLLVGGSDTPKVARTNSEAYDLYLLAKQRIYERTRPSIAAAAELLDKAIAADPNYAPAYAQRGIVSLLLFKGNGSYGDLPLKQSQAQGKLYLEKALQLDPQQPEAIAGMGLYHVKQPGELDLAIEKLKEALALNPGMIDAKNWLANSLTAAGRPGDSYQVTKELIQRDPLYRPAMGNAIGAMVGFGETAEARKYLDRVRTQIPESDLVLRYEAYLDLYDGQVADSLTGSKQLMARVPDDPYSNAIATWASVSLGEFEQALQYNDTFTRMLALFFSGRIEEAGLLATQAAEQDADVATLFTFFNLAGRSTELVNYLEDRWPDLETFQTHFPAYGTEGYSLMLEVALAYSRVGNELRFDDAMQRLSDVQGFLQSEGAANQNFFIVESGRFALAGDRQASLDYLQKAMDYGLRCGPEIQVEYPALSSLVDEPRFAEMQAQMSKLRDEERRKLGLEPMSS